MRLTGRGRWAVNGAWGMFARCAAAHGWDALALRVALVGTGCTALLALLLRLGLAVLGPDRATALRAAPQWRGNLVCGAAGAMFVGAWVARSGFFF